jgi:dTDP-glucose 4,6-dehydratase
MTEGHEVTGLNTWSSESQYNAEHTSYSRCVWGSVTDSEVVFKTVRGHDLVFHLAANIHVDESRHSPKMYFDSNVFGTFNVVEACLRHGASIVYASSCEVYGGSRQPIFEDFPMRPKSPYAASKAGGDALVYAHATTYGIPTAILRPANVFGPRQRSGSRGALIPIFVEKALRGEPLTIYGDGNQKRSFLYVKDLVKAYLFVMKRLQKDWPDIYNISSHQQLSVNDVAEAILELTGGKSSIIHGPARPGEVAAFHLDSSKLHGRGYSSDYAFHKGLTEYIQSKECLV